MAAPPPSKRIRVTDVPCIVTMQGMMKGKENIMSLAQGIVHWQPPPSVAKAVSEAASQPSSNSYCATEGLPELREALTKKLQVENGLENVRIMVTAGANQAYANIVTTLLDAEDATVLFAPYYFNHLMAIQMTGGADRVVFGQVDEAFLPDPSWLSDELSAQGSKVKMVTIVNPCNPTGVIIPRDRLLELSSICAKHGVWLIVDNTYEHFTYEDDGHPGHSCISGENIVNVFSFSKAFGMMGWRVGYYAYPERLHPEMLKAQDTIAICPPVMSQKAALAALTEGGADWVRERVRGLAENRHAVASAVEDVLGKDAIVGGSGAIYLMAKLPVQDDFRVVDWLSSKHGVCVIPGSACGAPGMIRLAYANLETKACLEASARLKAGLLELKQRGVAVLDEVAAAAKA